MYSLQLEHITKSYSAGWLKRDKKVVVNDVSLSIECGKTLGLIGMSGSGKSTLAKIIMGLVVPDEGKIFFEGQDIATMIGKKKKELCRQRQILFQHPASALNPRYTLRETMNEPFILHPAILPHAERREKIEAQLEFFSLDKKLLERYPHQLSGGQLQRFALARLLLLEPHFLILDEPTSMLDVSVQAQVMDLLARIQEEKGLTYLFITHDVDLARAYSDDIAVMYQGKIIECQDVHNIYYSPQQAYTKYLLEAVNI